MKKNRGFARKMKRELKYLKVENKRMRNVLEDTSKRALELSNKYHALRGRTREFSRDYIIGSADAYHMQQQGVSPDRQLVNSMLRELMESGEFADMFNFEKDSDFVGMGTRYRVSCEFLAPNIFRGQ